MAGPSDSPDASLHAGEEPSSWVLIRRLLALGWQFRWGCLRVLGLQTLVLGLSLAGLGLTGFGIDIIRHYAAPDTIGLGSWLGIRPPADWPAMRILATVAAGVLGLAVIHAAVWHRAMVCEAELVQQIIVHLRSVVYDKLQRLSFRFFDANQSGSIINRVTADVQAVRLFVNSVLIEGVLLILSLVFYMAYMLRIHVWLTLACLASTPLLWSSIVVFTRIVRPAYRRSRELADRMVLCLSENVQGMHVVKGFARQSEEIQKFQAANRAMQDQQQWIFWRVSTFVPLITSLTHLNQGILLGYGGYLVIQDKLMLGGGLIVFAGILGQLSARVANISTVANSVQRSLSGAARVFEVLDTPLEITSPPQAEPLPTKPSGVRFENVCFAYHQGQPVLHDICFTVEPGQTLAIIGATGAGKSTLLSLVPRFYDPTHGRVRVGGINVRDLDLDTLRRHLGVVFQDNFLFSHTVAANIAFGNPDASGAQIEKAARVAAIHDFIAGLPHGYDTVIGENGVDLSGGQRQRLAIARAVLLDAPILLLDDPTAGVDPQTEQEILEAMGNAVKNRTTLIVTHRLSTLRLADRIMLMDKGRILQTGTHEQLLHTSDAYRHMVQLQTPETELY